MKFASSVTVLISSLSFALVFGDVVESTGAASDLVGADLAALAAASINEAGIDEHNRDLQSTCGTVASWHPNYSLGWSQGKCEFTTTCNSPSYATNLACCKGAYPGQQSNFCISQLANPPTNAPTPTSAPTKLGEGTYYPDYTLAWTSGICINTTPIPSGRPTYSSMLACCKAAYSGQLSGACIAALPNKPTSAPTKVGEGTFYPDYTLPWPEGKCISTTPIPSGRPTYSSMLACCKAAYLGQLSGACFAALPNKPTSAPTKVGEGTFYPDYTLPWPEGKCISTTPIPSGRPTYSSMLACCKGNYGGQSTNACIKNLAIPPTTSPTKQVPDAWYPNYALPWPDGMCINTLPIPSGWPTYSSEMACCKASYGGQMSNKCIKGMVVQQGANIDGAASNDYLGQAVAQSNDGSILAIGAPQNLFTGSLSGKGYVRVYAWNGIAYVQRGADIIGEAATDMFGWSVSLSDDGSVLAVGAVKNDGANGIDSGHVRVYAWNGVAYAQRDVDIDGAKAGDYFGTSVSLSNDGSILAVGAYNHNKTATDVFVGQTRVYAWNTTTAKYVQRGAEIDGEADSDHAGWSVDISDDGSTLAIGARYNDGNSGKDSGQVRVYAWNSTTSLYVQQGADIDGASAGNYLGWSVALSSNGNIMAAGEPYYAPSVGLNQTGQVQVYAWNGVSYAQRGAGIVGEAAGDEFGRYVALSDDGSVLAVGAPFNDANGLSAGHVRVFDWNGANYVQRAVRWYVPSLSADINGQAAGDWFGFTISLSGDGTILAVGAKQSDGNGSNSGRVQVFHLL
jgi:hypothetical protein